MARYLRCQVKERVATTTAIIGTGNIGGTLARHLVRGGEPVVLETKDEANAAALAQELGELARAASVDSENKPTPLPWVAGVCHGANMVRGRRFESCAVGGLFRGLVAVRRDNILGTGLGDTFGATWGCSGRLKHQVETNSQGAWIEAKTKRETRLLRPAD
jgi:hypothetical protein